MHGALLHLELLGNLSQLRLQFAHTELQLFIFLSEISVFLKQGLTVLARGSSGICRHCECPYTIGLRQIKILLFSQFHQVGLH